MQKSIRPLTDDLALALATEQGMKESFRKEFLNAKKKFKTVLKAQDNPFFHSKYASLADYHAACDDALQAHGFALHQLLESDGTSNFLVTKLTHIDGHEEVSRVLIRSKDDTDPQKLGSAITYLRRYSIAALLGISSEDDDGNKVSEAGAENNTHEYSTKTNPAPVQTSYDPNWLIPFGKHKGQKISTVAIEDLQSYVSWLETDATKNGEPLKGNALRLKQMTAARAQTDPSEPPPISDDDYIGDPFR